MKTLCNERKKKKREKKDNTFLHSSCYVSIDELNETECELVCKTETPKKNSIKTPDWTSISLYLLLKEMCHILSVEKSVQTHSDLS